MSCSVAAASGAGDPHYTSFFRRYYDFQGSGDFSILEVVLSDDDLSTGDPLFVLQGRMIQVSPWYGATVQQAFAFGNQELAFQVQCFQLIE